MKRFHRSLLVLMYGTKRSLLTGKYRVQSEFYTFHCGPDNPVMKGLLYSAVINRGMYVQFSPITAAAITRLYRFSSQYNKLLQAKTRNREILLFIINRVEYRVKISHRSYLLNHS